MATARKRRPVRAMGRTQALLAALDIGCSKVTCLIARPNGADPTRFDFLGGGHQQTKGFQGGVITDMEALERSIRLAVEDAERQAGVRIERVVLSVTGPRLDCRLVSGKIDISGRAIGAKDVRRVEAMALEKASQKPMQILTAHPVAYRIDEQDGVRDPRGMYGDQLSALVSVITAPKTFVKTLVECVGRAHLEVDRLVPAAIATAMGALIKDEQENGAVCIDMGGGVTTACMFMNGAPAWVCFVPVGGQHVTSDLAQGLGTTFAAAERMKTLHGTLDADGPGSAERLECPRLGDDGRLQAGRIIRGELAHIIRPRVAEVFEYLSERLNQSALRSVMPRRIVLTGGASQLRGLREVVSGATNMPVRLARPVTNEHLGEAYASPAFSTAAGLLTYQLAGLPDVIHTGRTVGAEDGTGRLKKMLRWLKENF